MPSLNLRDVEPKLVTTLKARAKQRGQTLRDYCVSLLDVPSEPPKSAKAVAATIPGVTTAAKLPSDRGLCPRCGAKLITWGPQQRRCVGCATNYGG